MHKNQTTPGQESYLRRLGVEVVPPKRNAASRLISYLNWGNDTGTDGKSKSERVAILTPEQRRWIGKQVIYFGNKRGTVLFLSAKTRNEVAQQRRLAADLPGPACQISPFLALVRLDDGKEDWRSVGTLKLVEAE